MIAALALFETFSARYRAFREPRRRLGTVRNTRHCRARHGENQAGEGMHRQMNIRVGFVITQQNIVFRAMRFDEIALKNQRLGFGARIVV